jgi:hypothetical protein
LGCDSFDDGFTDCNLGFITGKWQIHYTATNGNCGPRSDETVIYTGGPGASSAGCSITTSLTTDDQCRIRSTSACPTTDDLGMEEWTSVLTQTAADQVEGRGTVQVNHTTLGNCRSTYDITITRL